MKELIRQGYIGNPAQLVTLRRVTVNEGKAKGTEIIEVQTPVGWRWIFCRMRDWTLANAAIKA